MIRYYRFMLILFVLAIAIPTYVGCQEATLEKVEFTIGGSYQGSWRYNPYVLTSRLLPQHIMLSIAKEFKSESEIAKELGVNLFYINDEITLLKEGDLVREANGKYIANGIVISEKDKELIEPFIGKMSLAIAEMVITEIPSLKTAFNKCSFKKQGYSWDQMKFLILSAHVLDLSLVDRGFKRYGIVAGEPPVHPGKGEWFLKGIEGGRNVKWPMSHNLCPSDKGGYAIFFCRWKDREDWPPKISLSETEAKIMDCILKEPKSESKIIKESNISEEEVEAIINRLCKSNWIKIAKDKYKVNFPVFYKEDNKIMISEMDRIADSIIKKVYKPRLKEVEGLFRECGFEENRNQYGAFERELFVTISNRSMQILIEKGILSSPPAKPPWIIWGWIGKVQWWGD